MKTICLSGLLYFYLDPFGPYQTLWVCLSPHISVGCMIHHFTINLLNENCQNYTFIYIFMVCSDLNI
jgi:hypothetical protein